MVTAASFFVRLAGRLVADLQRLASLVAGQEQSEVRRARAAQPTPVQDGVGGQLRQAGALRVLRRALGPAAVDQAIVRASLQGSSILAHWARLTRALEGNPLPAQPALVAL